MKLCFVVIVFGLSFIICNKHYIKYSACYKLPIPKTPFYPDAYKFANTKEEFLSNMKLINNAIKDSTELFGTGPVVDNMNIIRNELNKQGFNYGERLNYKAIHTKEGNIIPFNESALTSLKYNSFMGKKAHYIKTK